MRYRSLAVAIASLIIALAGCGGGGNTMGVSARPPSPSDAFGDLIGIDYDPEARCSTDNWSTTSPVACSPQPAFVCPASGATLDNCPSLCQSCYDGDLGLIKNTLSVGLITIYQPNYFILMAAQTAGVKVILGTFNDTVAGLAQPASSTGCTYGGFPSACGLTYANSLISGACGTTTPFSPTAFCSGGTFISAWSQFLQNGTVVGIQLGNEVLSNGLTPSQVTGAATTMRSALDTAGYASIPIVISLQVGTEPQLCTNGAPPAGVDFIAAHPYCTNVAGVPPSWPASAMACIDEVTNTFQTVSQHYCGASTTYIGETGYNTGCPAACGTANITNAQSYIGDAVSWACMQKVPTFLFAFADACPAGGCCAGCAASTTCTGTSCSGLPIEGNGYFGLYYTDGYQTMGSPVPKYSSMPSLVCP